MIQKAAWEEEPWYKCTLCGQEGFVGKCCGEETRIPLNKLAKDEMMLNKLAKDETMLRKWTFEDVIEHLEDARVIEPINELEVYRKWIPLLRIKKAQENTEDEVASVIEQQANDEGLWFNAQTASEAYLQQELRRLHAIIEGEKDE